MKWRRVRSRDVSDARGRGGGGGMSLPIPIGRAGGGLGGLGLVGLLIYLAIQWLGGGARGLNVGPAFGTGVQAPGAPSAQGIPASQDPQRDLKDFSIYVFTDVQRTWEATFRREGDPYKRAQLVLYSGGVHTVRSRELRRRSVLLPCRRSRVPRPQLLRRHAPPAGRAWGLRLGLRDRPRDGPPRLERDGDERRSPPPAAGEPRRREPALSAARAAGGLLCRGLGQHRVQAGGPAERATSTRRSTPPPRFETTACSDDPAAASTPTASPTEPRRSARSGSRPALRAATPALATPSRSTSLSRVIALSKGGTRGSAVPDRRYARRAAPWRSGYAAACKAVYTGSIPVGASQGKPRYGGVFPCSGLFEGRRRCTNRVPKRRRTGGHRACDVGPGVPSDHCRPQAPTGSPAQSLTKGTDGSLGPD